MKMTPRMSSRKWVSGIVLGPEGRLVFFVAVAFCDGLMFGCACVIGMWKIR